MTKLAKARSETDLAAPVIRWLSEELGFDVYQEVPWGARADILGLRPKLTCVVELKLSLGLDVIAQALRWTRYAHWVYVAVPRAKHSDGRTLAFEVCEQRGIGVIEIQHGQANLVRLPRLNRKILDDPLRKAAQPEHKTFAPAGSRGAHWSPWRASVARLKAHVERNDGCTIKDAVAQIGHHWSNNSSARSCITTQIQAGIIKGLRIDQGRLFIDTST